jgi:hypothetical protein
MERGVSNAGARQQGLDRRAAHRGEIPMIRKLKSGKYRLYSRKKNPETGKRRNLGTFKTKAAAKKHEKAVQYFKRH